ncbi:MAG: UDP-N-acetylmuramoyl-L-alanine--D-glutamate ligase [Proteobacteria bacterium]|nr:MAG: UDP-N-acetylmuramoyl-L-alanine--D-glutamate ligase [Pseudomonadota bacterium]
MGNLDLRHKRVLVVGLGRSGVAATHFLTRCGARVTVTDRAPAESLTESIKALEGCEFRLKCGGHDADDFERADCVVLSPGVPHTLPMLEPAWAGGTPVIGEMELAAMYVDEPMIAVTGTNGKTTTTELVGGMLRCSGKKVFVGGNIGAPLTGYVNNERDRADVVVVETSSFQLDTTIDFRPDTGVLLNISDDHLDRYTSVDAYAESKWRLFKNQQMSDSAVLNAMDKTIAKMLPTHPLAARRLIFSDQSVIDGACISKECIRVFEFGRQVATYSLAGSRLIGGHNRENIAAACLAARAHGATDEGIQKAIDSYQGLPHRLEPVATVGGVTFVNDSKATNVDAVKRALECFDQRIVLIMGGQNKDGNFDQLKALVNRRVKVLVVMGEARDEIVTALTGEPEQGVREVASMREAVEAAYDAATAGEVVLLSPACASFDMFVNYAQRGSRFKDCVERLG